MSLIRRSIRPRAPWPWALLVLSLMVGACDRTEDAAEAERRTRTASEVEDLKLEGFIRAYAQITPMHQQALEGIKSAKQRGNALQQQMIEANFADLSAQILRRNGLTRAEYQHFVNRLNDDPQLSARALAKMQDLRSRLNPDAAAKTTSAAAGPTTGASPSGP